MIEPAAGVRQAFRRQSEQVVDGALQSKCRRVVLADRRINAIGAIQADDRDFRRIAVDDRHVYRRRFTPETKQAPASLCQFVGRKLPNGSIDHGARPRGVLRDLAAFLHQIDQRLHIPFIPQLSKQTSDVLKPDDERRGKVDSRT